MSEQPNLGELLREAGEALECARDKLDAAMLLEREQREQVDAKLRDAVEAFGELAHMLGGRPE